MDDSPSLSLSAEERKVRAARRFGRIGLAITVIWLLSVPAVMLWMGPPSVEFAVPLFALYFVAIGLHLWRIRQHINSLGTRAAPWFMIVASAVGLAITLVGLGTGFGGFIWALVGGVLLGDVVAGLRARWIAIWVVAAGLIVLTVGYVISAPAMRDFPLSPWFPTGFAAFYVVSMWTIDVERLWWLRAVTDLDDSRRTAAELAATRERLRLADDLHDILGHALEVVAFKSELASRLQDVDPERAKAEMEQVQQVARASLNEVRTLVRDRRPTDLVQELAGAKAVLGSAGVELQVVGDPETVDPAVRPVLGRVLREAMTNVLRHSDPTRCSIRIETDDGRSVLHVENDGVLPPSGHNGTGLAALARYLQDRRGYLDAKPSSDGTFRVTAVVPVGSR